MRFGSGWVVVHANLLFVLDFVGSGVEYLVSLRVGLMACVGLVGSVWPT